MSFEGDIHAFSARIKNADVRQSRCSLPLGRERRRTQIESENDREPDQAHGHLG